MSPVDRATARSKRREGKRRDNGPLLRLVQEEVTKRPVKARKAVLMPLTEAQDRYDRSIETNAVTFGIGPAGTGKTWFAAMRAAQSLQANLIERIIVTRPAVDCDESLGFLPGELDEKYEPYFRPVRDAFEEALGSGHLEYLLKAKVIEARPLGQLRGSTLKNCWVLADEMQNATINQTKTLLTRIGENAKFIINGDPRQCDLPNPAKSGLMDAVRRLDGLISVATITFTDDDIVRSGLCQDIVRRYETRPEPVLEVVDSGLKRVLRVD